MVQTIQQSGEKPLVLHSQILGPLSELSFLEASLLFAELAMIAYNDEKEASIAAHAIGFDEAIFFDRDGAQAFAFRTEHDIVITCRGTEPNEWNDIEADVKATSVLAETVGKVHGGFKEEVDHIWPDLEAVLKPCTLPTWFCGHSLGGAMATICASRCQRTELRARPAGLFTYGSPRVGDRLYGKNVRLNHYRWVHNNDIVTRVPPLWMGFHHHGQRQYIDHRGRVRNISGEALKRDRWLGFVDSLKKGRLDHFSDHAIHTYAAALADAVNKEG